MVWAALSVNTFNNSDCNKVGRAAGAKQSSLDQILDSVLNSINIGLDVEFALAAIVVHAPNLAENRALAPALQDMHPLQHSQWDEPTLLPHCRGLT